MDRKILLAGAILAMTIAGTACGGGGDTPDGREAAAASEAWAGYKSAILAKDGTKAAGHLSTETIAYYEDIRMLALGADKDALASEAMVDRLNVVTMRVMFSSAELRAVDGSGLVREAVERGLIGEAGTASTELRSVKVSGDTAVGDLVSGDTTGGRLDFRRESGAWKIHLVALLQSVDGVLRQTARDRGLEENAFIVQAVGAASGKPVSEDVWDPTKF
ncbi:MAG TPA: hypothetical protein VJ922_08465 [Actinomycetota bacterium]|nr:hypothetical protein [Actinomycetota bacterium]